MKPEGNPLRAQRLLFAGLLGVMLVSALLLWYLGRDARPARHASVASESGAPGVRAAPLEDAALPAATDGEPTREALPVRATSHESPSLAADAFEPDAVYGRLRLGTAPVEGAELRLFRGALGRRGAREPLAETKSAADGAFRFRGLDPAGRYRLHVQGARFLPVERQVFSGHAEEIALERAASVRGRVLSAATGQPLAGIDVALERAYFGAQGMEDLLRSTSDAEGRWQLDWAKPGIENFLVLRAGKSAERREFQVAAEGGDGYDIELGDALALELEIVDLGSGVPFADTEILCDDRRVRTDGRGRIGVPLAPGSSDDWLRLAVSLPGGCLTQGRVSRTAAHGLVRVPVTRGGKVRGHVLDAAGAPVAEAEVRIGGSGRLPAGIYLPDGFWLNPARLPARSGADGGFELVGLPPREGEVEVLAQHPEHPAGRSEPFAFAELGAEVELTVHMEHGGVIEGLVTLDGVPAALQVHWNAARGSGWTRANDHGRYRLIGVPSGEVALAARLDDEDEDEALPGDRTVQVEEEKTLTCDLVRVSNRTAIQGRVLDSAGKPVSEVEVSCSASGEAEVDFTTRARSTADGAFELSVPDTPGLLFEVWAEDGARSANLEDVAAGARGLELVLPAQAELALRVVDAASRQPVQGFQLYWRSADGGDFTRLVQGGRRFSPGPDGVFVAELPAGRLDLAVSARALGYAPLCHDGIELGPERRESLTLALERGIELEIEFQPAPEADYALAQLQRTRLFLANEEELRDREHGGDFFQQEVRNAQAVRADEHGLARLTALAPGLYRFVNAPKGLTFRPERIELPPVANLRVTIGVEPAAPRNEKPPRKGD